MSDRQIGFLAIAIWISALVPIGSSLAGVGVGLGMAGVGWRRSAPIVVIVGAVVMASCGAGAAWARIGPGEAQTFAGHVLLVSDPEPVTGGIRVTAEIEGQRYLLRAWGSSAGWLRNRLMGETITIEAGLRPLGDAPTWMRARGLSGRGTVTSVGGFDVGSPHTRLANSIRRTIESGAESLDRDDRALFAGLVYGDDRAQSPLTADNFDAAGLTHLLAVSGQNVAFVLAIAGPVLRRLAYRPRFVFVVLVLLLFATVTRFEPSVVRASVMTGVAAVGALVGTEVSSRRILSLAIGALILVDPLIVHSVAFQLSVAASAGILFWSGRVARAVPGPRVLAESLAVTATAQLAVAPLLVWRFDGLPVASLPANLLAGPVAGPIMMWGLTVGLIAGLVPAGLAAATHLPTKCGLWWIDSVAASAPEVPLGRLGGMHIAILFAAGAFGLQQHERSRRLAAAVVIVIVLLHPAVALATADSSSEQIDGATMLWRDDQTTILELDGGSRPQRVLAGLRAANVGAIDLVIVRQSSFGNALLIGWIKSHHRIAHVWAPEPTLGVGEQVPTDGTQLGLAGFTLTVAKNGSTLHTTATPTDPNPSG